MLEKIEDLIDRRQDDMTKWILGATIITVFLFFTLYTVWMPYRYTVEATDGNQLYQYQSITTDDIKITAKWFFRDEEITDEEYHIGEYDERDETSGQVVVLDKEDGELKVTLKNGREISEKVDIIPAKSAELGYDGSSNINDILDESKIYIDVTYADGTTKRYMDGLFKVLKTDNLVLHQGFNDFTVDYAGVVFPLSVACTGKN